MINSFTFIGWIDPFPNELRNDKNSFADTNIKKQILEDPLVKLIYSDNKTFGKTPPFMVYIPNKVIMFKIMRACIDINKKDMIS
jgi:hypothetical protein